jgi:DNA-binding Lrp family transcriptional regulator
MDRLDRKILAIFQHDTRRIAEAIGAEVGLSAAAVQRRIKRLREDGTIAAEVAVLDNKSVGTPITCIVTLALAKTAGHLELFKRKIGAEPAVQQCYHVTGGSDIILVVTAASMEEYGAFARAWFETHDVTRYETHVVLDRVKVGLSLPIAIGPIEAG